MKTFVIKIMFILAFSFLAFTGKAQVNDYDSITPAPFHSVREADMAWIKRVWRVIDMHEKLNESFYFPTATSIVQKSFMQMVMYAFKYGSIKAYEPVNEEYTIPYTYEQFVAATTDTQHITLKRTTPPFDSYDTVITKPFDPASVTKIRIKEDWFYNRYYSQMDVRIIGICPIVDVYEADGITLKGVKPLFWIYYPQARKVLANAFVCNSSGNKRFLSYDSLFIKRLFISYVYKTSNVYEKKISENSKGLDAILESEKIKEDIYRFEDDMWDY